MKSLFSCSTFYTLLIAIMCMFAGSALVSCNGDDQPYHEARYSADGKDSVVFVHYRDENGNYNDFFMQYLLFNSLFNNGGYHNCYQHQARNPVYQRSYSTYTSRTVNNSYVNSKTTSTGSSGFSAPSKSYSSPTRSTTPAKSYSSPSRSSTPSYSSPSKSYSSPSRSYSTPSRSYSSPSRSYSSPSRH